MIDILIVDDQKVVREQLKNYFNLEPDLQVIGTAENSIEALEKIKTLKPNVVFMDIEMPGGISGLEMTGVISNLYSEAKVIILTGNYTPEYGQTSVLVGAEAYLSKTASAEELIETVRQVCRQDRLVRQELDLYSSEQIDPQWNTIGFQDSNQSKFDETPLYRQEQKSDKSPNLKKYLGMGVLLNSFVWLSALAYFKLTPPIYTSQWGVKILESDPQAEVVSANDAQADQGEIVSSTPDPQNDYIYLAKSRDLLAKTASLVGMTVKEYQKPRITANKDNGIIAFEINGNTPQQAQAKAIAFHQAITEQIEELRRSELARQEVETQATLASAKEKLVAAQAKLSQYRAKSGVSTDKQIQNLTDNLENLRRQKAELAAQQQGLSQRYNQPHTEVKTLTTSNNQDAYRLAGDAVYQKHKTRYAQLKSSLHSALDRFTPEHPIVREREAELNSTVKALEQRATQILGRPVNVNYLTQIVPLAIATQSTLVRNNLPQNLLKNRAGWQQLKAQNQELSAQINSLEIRWRKMSQDQVQIERLKQEVQVAETVFATTLAKLDSGQENIYAIYPPLQLINQPNLPESVSHPSPAAILMGGLAGSFLVTTGLTLFWFNEKKFRSESISEPFFDDGATRSLTS